MVGTARTGQGFELVTSNGWQDVIVRNEGTMVTGKKTKSGVSRHHSVLFDGRLRVTDSTAFQKALSCGIGPAKAFGFGLLSIAPVNS